MKQAMAIGASRMTRPISRIVTSNRPSIAVQQQFATASVLHHHQPDAEEEGEKTITANMSLPAMAAMMLSGMMASTAAPPRSACRRPD